MRLPKSTGEAVGAILSNVRWRSVGVMYSVCILRMSAKEAGFSALRNLREFKKGARLVSLTTLYITCLLPSVNPTKESRLCNAPPCNVQHRVMPCPTMHSIIKHFLSRPNPNYLPYSAHSSKLSSRKVLLEGRYNIYFVMRNKSWNREYLDRNFVEEGIWGVIQVWELAREQMCCTGFIHPDSYIRIHTCIRKNCFVG